MTDDAHRERPVDAALPGRLAEQGPDVMYAYRLSEPRGFEYVSPAVSRITGYTPAEHYADPDLPWRIVHPDDQPVLSGQLREPPPDYEPTILRWIHRNGRVVWTEHRHAFRRDAGGNVCAVEGIVRDVTEQARTDGQSLGILQDVSERTRMLRALRDSEDRYRDLVEHSSDLICTHDLDGRLFSVNRAAERLLGYPADRLVGRNIRDLLIPEARDGFDEYLARLRRTGAAQGRMQVRTARGDARIWEFENTLRTEGVDAPVVRGRARDVTDRVQAERALRYSEERLRLAVEASGQGMIDIDLQSRIADVSPELAAMMGCPRERFQAPLEELAHLLHPGDREPALAALRDHIAGRTAILRAEFRLQTHTGTWKWLLAHGGDVQRGKDGAPARLLSALVDIDDLKRAELEQAREASRRHVLFERAADGIAVLGSDGSIIEANTSLARMLGLEPHELKTLRLSDWDEAFAARATAAASHADAPVTVETRLRRRDGSTLDVDASYTPGEWGGQKLVFYVCRDISARKQAEAAQAALHAQLIHAQKMESIGRLAGGVAHDFNNLLGVILGYSDLVLERVADAELRADLEEIQRAARRSADLTQRLLAFSRRQPVTPRMLDLNDAVAGTLKMLRRLIGENIELTWRPSDTAATVRIDPAQIDSLLANLCVNARDAIAGAGHLTIETRAVVIGDSGDAARRGVIPGDYVLLTISDDGCGMCDEALTHLFEPFYTTKPPGQGTGLGLATVYGIVKQNDGYIMVRSEAGIGTTFEILLPRLGAATEYAPLPAPAAPRGQAETILLVEDEAAILHLVQVMLGGLGYRVLPASSPAEALDLAAAHDGPIDLLMTDVVMPGMDGRELAVRVQQVRPGAGCLFMSGYTADVLADGGVMSAGVHLLRKPFARAELAAAVRDVLAAAPQPMTQGPERSGRSSGSGARSSRLMST